MADSDQNNNPKAGRSALPTYSLGKQKLDPNNPKDAKLIEIINAQNNIPAAKVSKSKKSADTESDDARTARLQRIGDIIQEKISAERGGTLNTSQTATNSKVFETFIAQTKQREDLLKTASDEQKEIFASLEETLISLREADKAESDKLRQTLGELSGQLKQTADSPAKEKIGQVLNTAQEQAQPITKMGIFNTLQEGKVAASAKMLGTFLINKLENHIENKYGEKITGQRAATSDGVRSSELGAILKALQGQKPSKLSAGSTRSSTERQIKNPGMPGATASVSAASSGLGNITTDVLNVSAGTVNITGGKKQNIVEDEEEPGILDTLLDFAGFGKDKATAATTKTAKKSGAKSAKPVKGKATVRARDARGRFTSAPAKGASKLGTLAKFGGRALGAAGLGLGGYFAYQDNKDRGTGAASAIAGTTMGGALGGAAAGAALGTMIMPGVGTIAGGLIGGALGAFGGQAAGEAGADALGYTAPAMIQGVPKTQGQTIAVQTATNKELTKTDNKPIVIPVPAPAAPAVQSGGPTMMLPRGNMRPTESAYDKYVNRGTNFV